MGKNKQLSSEEQRERAEARLLANGLANGITDGGGGGANPGDFKGTCNKCGKSGHRQVDCPSASGGGKGGKGGGQAEAPVKTGKGHKQRGAGAVLSASGPVETRSGVVKKDWQRLPTQLLLEWTQREKRPKPQYYHARPNGGKGGKGGKGKRAEKEEEEDDPSDWRKYLTGPPEPKEEPTEFRQRVVLADPKHQDRNLMFCPAQPSPTEPLAKEHAALLGLLQVCGNLPLDKKLPDEFREVWLASMNSTAPAAGNNKTSGGSKPSATTATKAQPSSAAVASVDAAGKDKSGSHTTTVSKDGDSNDGSSTNPPVMALSVDRKFASKAEARMAEAEKAAARASKQRRQEALAKANADAPVLLSAKMVALLEMCLGIGSHSQGTNSSGSSSGNGGDMALTSLSGNMRTAAEACVVAGFSSEAAVMAVMQASAQVGKEDAEEEKETGDASALEAEALAWLVLHVPEDDLPSSFRGKQGAHALPTLLKPGSGETSAALNALTSLPSAVTAHPQARAHNDSSEDAAAAYPGEGCYGFSVADFRRACLNNNPMTVKPSGVTVNPNTSTATDASTWVTLSSLLLKWSANDGDSSFLLNDTSGELATVDADAAEALENELMVVESMFAGDVSIVTVAKEEEGDDWGCCLTVTSSSNATGGGEGQQFTVDFWLPNPGTKTSVYPSRGGVPCVLLRNGSVACQCALASQAALLISSGRDDDDGGDAPAVLVDLLTWVEDHAYQRRSRDGSIIWEVEPLGVASKRMALIGRAGSLFAEVPPPLLEEAVEALSITEIDSSTLKADETSGASTTVGVAPPPAPPKTAAPATSSNTQSSKASSKRSGGGVGGQRRFGGFWDVPPPVAGSSSSKGGKGGASAVPAVPLRLQRERASLPAHKSRSEVVQQLNSSRVILVSGGTGCGKTTQVPQFILEEARAAGQPCKVVVCQPRRLAAVGVATRVHDELGEAAAHVNLGSPGSRIGYMVRGDSKCCAASCQLLFCTTGVLLQRLRSDPTLANVTHLIVDEVHERHLDADFLLAALKIVLLKHQKLKVVMMSATLDAHKFASYFSSTLSQGGPSTSKSNGPSGKAAVSEMCPIVSIPGQTYPVQDFYLDDVSTLTGYLPRNLAIERAAMESAAWNHLSQSNSSFSVPDGGFRMEDGADYYKTGEYDDGDDDDSEDDDVDDGHDDEANSVPAASGARYGEKEKKVKEGRALGGAVDVKCALDYKLLVKLVRSVVDQNLQGEGGSLLIFMPGVGEISRLCGDLARYGGAGLHVLALHGALPAHEQNRVFAPPSSRSAVKVIVATNVAETSITIPDCTVVIDTARTKQTGFDGDRGAGSLFETWTAKDAMQQRRGRAGRVKPGICYRLVTRRLYESLPEHTLPEISRSPLDSLVLMVKANGYGSPQAFLSTFLDPPPPASVRAAVSSLRAIQALAPATAVTASSTASAPQGKKPPSSAASSSNSNPLELTSLGGHLASLPCNPRLGKLLVLGCVLGVGDLALSVAACLSIRSPLLNHTQIDKGRVPALEVKAAREELLSLSKAKNQHSDHCFWAALLDTYRVTKTTRDKKDLCDALGLSFVRMMELVALRKQLGDAVQSLGFDLPSDDKLHSSVKAVPLSPTTSSSGAVAVPRPLSEWRLLSASLCGALWPNAAKVRRPVQKYHETLGGTVEANPEAKELKFQIQVPQVSTTCSSRNSGGGASLPSSSSSCEEQVWIHPSSVAFAQQKFASPWLVYSDLVSTSRAFLRDVSEVSPYAVLLFGGPLRVDVRKGTIAVLTPATLDATSTSSSSSAVDWSSGAEWCRFSANPPKVGALVGALRTSLDALLDRKFADPSLEVHQDPVSEALVKLLVTQGMG